MVFVKRIQITNPSSFWGISEVENDYLTKMCRKVMQKQGKIIDSFIKSHVPAWKWWILKTTKSDFLAVLLNVNIAIYYTRDPDLFNTHEMTVDINSLYILKLRIIIK